MIDEAEALARLHDAEWLGRPPIQKIFAVLDGDRGRTRAVGGIVRDTLLGRLRETADVDMATEIVPEEVMARAAQAGIAAHPTGIAHGTVTLALDGQAVEVTTLREDVETDGRHALVRFGTDWQRDAARRDFSLNALYVAADGALFDPLGGLPDCLSGVIRFIGDPDQRIAEDRLRVLRFFRFSASHGGQVFDPAGLAACRRAAGTLGALSAERVGGEMLRMLALPSVAATLEAMANAGIDGVPAPALALLARLERLSDRPPATARLALILQAEPVDALQWRWRLSNDIARRAADTNLAAHLLVDGAVNEAVYRFGLLIEMATVVAATIADWSREEVGKLLRAIHEKGRPVFPLAGADLVRLGFRPGKALGQELVRLERLWIDSDFTLDASALVALAKP